MTTAKAASTTIPRVHKPSVEAFVTQYLKPGKPVIIQGAMEDWKARSRWTPQYLMDKVGHKDIHVHQSPDGMFGIDPEKGGPRYEPREMTFGTFVEWMSSPEDADPRLYMQRLSIPDLLPELNEDFSLPPYINENQIFLTNLWFGPGGNTTRLHYDVPNNFLAHLYGRKRLVMFPPRQSPYLYACRPNAYNMSRLDLDQPDLTRFPNFSKAQPIECFLEAGEMIFIPSFWWHQVYSLETGISINFWWLPRLRQYVAPQLFDTLADIVKEGKRHYVERFRTRKSRLANVR